MVVGSLEVGVYMHRIEKSKVKMNFEKIFF